jgi:uncharacterized Fe-S cluster protein YjdI
MEEEERKRADVAREYSTEQITVYWEPKYYIHTANCLNAEPQVFDVRRRPWIIADAADADRVARAVTLCPTGALHFRRTDGAEQEPTPEETTVQPRLNGPLFLRGDIKLINARGDVIREDTRVALCRCGQSANKPFCDGTHRAVGFQAR